MPNRTFRVLTFLSILCAAGAARAQQFPEVCEHRLPKDPAYYADMKEMPRGKWNLGDLFEKAQLDNPSTPVVVRGLATISSAKQRAVKISCVELENRSARAVKSVRLRWSLVERAEGEMAKAGAPVLAKGTLPDIGVELQPGARLKAEVQGAHYADFLRPLVTPTGEVNGQYDLYVGVARVEYADGTAEDLP